jgi:hypothetical protein
MLAWGLVSPLSVTPNPPRRSTLNERLANRRQTMDRTRARAVSIVIQSKLPIGKGDEVSPVCSSVHCVWDHDCTQ